MERVSTPTRIDRERRYAMEIEDQIRKFLGRFFDDNILQDDDDIFAIGQANSLFAVQLVMFVESRFGISIDNEDLEIDNFRSIKAISEFIVRKRNGYLYSQLNK
jgi:methoxymalonate biosynthesis acyl carrier protein